MKTKTAEPPIPTAVADGLAAARDRLHGVSGTLGAIARAADDCRQRQAMDELEHVVASVAEGLDLMGRNPEAGAYALGRRAAPADVAAVGAQAPSDALREAVSAAAEAMGKPEDVPAGGERELEDISYRMLRARTALTTLAGSAIEKAEVLDVPPEICRTFYGMSYIIERTVADLETQGERIDDLARRQWPAREGRGNG